MDKDRKDGKIDLVIELYDDGMPVEKIAKLSKMTVKEVREIVEQQTNK
jgi:predicted HTH domain antitoxin